MVCYIDIAFTGISNFEFMKNYIKNIAKKYNYSHYYISHEIRKGRRNLDIKCVMTVQFSNNNIEDIINFLKIIKNIPEIYINSIYNNR